MKAESLVVRNVRVAGGEHPTDIVVVDGRIAELAPSGRDAVPDQGLSVGVPVEDGGGALALPGLIDAHAHLDKTLRGAPWVPHSAGPALADRIANGQARREELDLPSPVSVPNLLRVMVRQGTTAVRAHTDV